MRSISPLLTGVLMLAAAVVLRSQDGLPALPDPDVFFAATQQNLLASGRVQYEFAYKERRTELHTNPFGRLGTGDDLLYEVFPLTEGTGYTRRLIERAGEVVEDAEVERVERRPREQRGAPAAFVDGGRAGGAGFRDGSARGLRRSACDRDQVCAEAGGRGDHSTGAGGQGIQRRSVGRRGGQRSATRRSHIR